MRYCSCIKMVLDKVVNLKEFWWPNKEIKYFSRSSTEFKVLSRQLPKFKTFWRLYKPWLFLLWCFLARTKHNCCLWCMIEFNCTKICKPMKDHERVAVAAEFWPLPVISLLLFKGIILFHLTVWTKLPHNNDNARFAITTLLTWSLKSVMFSLMTVVST